MFEPVAQLDRGQRVEAELLEGLLGLDRLGGGVAEHRGDLGPDQVQDEGLRARPRAGSASFAAREPEPAWRRAGTRTRPAKIGGRTPAAA